MAGICVNLTPELAGPIYSGIEIVPFWSEKDSYTLNPADATQLRDPLEMVLHCEPSELANPRFRIL